MFDAEFKKCMRFLKKNGWHYQETSKGEPGVYVNELLVAVELHKDEIVLLDGHGDFLHLPMNYYALVGAMIEFRQIACNYRK